MSFNPMKFPSRPFRFALVLKITLCFLAADASLAAADVLLIKSQQPAVVVNAAASTAGGADCRNRRGIWRERPGDPLGLPQGAVRRGNARVQVAYEWQPRPTLLGRRAMARPR